MSKNDNEFTIKLEEIKQEELNSLKSNLSILGNFSENRFRNIGPIISGELKEKTIYATLFVVLIIIIFITYVFREVSKPVSSFKYGLVAVLTMLHDIIVPLTFFSIAGTFTTLYQIDILFVTAILAILGYSVNDTIVIFDRIRENLKKSIIEKEVEKDGKKEFVKIYPQGEEFKKLVGKSLQQTFKRSLFTSITTFIVLVIFFFLGSSLTEHFALTLLVGVLVGTYSSLFFASPLLVLLEEKQKKEHENTQEN